MDASVTAAWFLGKQGTNYSNAVLTAVESGAKIFVPAIWPLEILNTLLIAERRRLITESDVRKSIGKLIELSIQIDYGAKTLPFDDVEYVARRFGRSAYDASYLELAMRKGLPLATKDEALRGAAVAAGVTLFVPEADAVA